MCFWIAFSRVYNGVHTYNQIALGWILGISLYVLFCHVLYNELVFFMRDTTRYSWRKLAWNKGTITFYVIYLLAILNFLYGDLLHPAPESWKEQIAKNCAGLNTSGYTEFETENFVRFNLGATIVGSYLGVIVEQRFMDTAKYIKFNQTSVCMTVFRVIIGFIIALPILSPIVLTPKTGIHWTTKVLWKTVIPIGFGNFYLYGFNKYISLKLGMINTTTEEEETKGKKTL